jgi:hypothetical protein
MFTIQLFGVQIGTADNAELVDEAKFQYLDFKPSEDFLSAINKAIRIEDLDFEYNPEVDTGLQIDFIHGIVTIFNSDDGEDGIELNMITWSDVFKDV